MRRDPAPWAPDCERETFVHVAPSRVLQLVRDIESGRYQPQDVRQYAAFKPTGGHRVISAHYGRDKFAQRLFTQAATPRIEPHFHNDSYAYRPGRGVRDAIARVHERLNLGLFWIVDADIRKFFDRVVHRILLDKVRTLTRCRRVHKLIRLWLDAGPLPDCTLRAKRGLLQGAVISPLMCNLYMTEMDNLWHRNNIPFIRFADDFLLMCESKADAQRALQFTQQNLHPLGLELNCKKTQIRHIQDGIRFLGRRLRPQRRARRQLKHHASAS